MIGWSGQLWFSGRMDDELDFRANRLFVDAPLDEGGTCQISRDQANYLINVLRLGNGGQILVFNGRDGEWLASVETQGRRDATLRLHRQVRAQASGPDVHYWFAPLKRSRLDYMVQKATELGVGALQPVMTRRTVAERVNIERMQANVIEAAEQCGVLRLPEVRAPISLAKLLAAVDPYRALIFCDEGAPIADPVAALRAVPPGPLAFLIGPEGGFDPAEREALLALPAVTRLSLGPRIMRADTAAVAALALINAVLGDWH
ncbi:MAG: 16S rRNA (uracil(1498)-N(3))-methyltransferase [Hyphomicrobiaceae bacterium]